MRIVNLEKIDEAERRSPGGKFHKFVKDISIALGRERDSLDLAKRHPFDLAWVRIPAASRIVRIIHTQLRPNSTSLSRAAGKSGTRTESPR